jgi:hypothetical protein
MGGPEGILAHIAALAASKTVPSASSYCKVCRACTWLGIKDVELSTAALDFWHQWKTTESMTHSMQVMKSLLRVNKCRRVRKRLTEAGNDDKGQI